MRKEQPRRRKRKKHIAAQPMTRSAAVAGSGVAVLTGLIVASKPVVSNKKFPSLLTPNERTAPAVTGTIREKDSLPPALPGAAGGPVSVPVKS